MRSPVSATLALALAIGCDHGPRPPARVDLRPSRGAVVAHVGDLDVTDLDVAAVAAERHLSARAALDVLLRDALLATEARRAGVVGPTELADAAWRARLQGMLARDVEARFSETTVPPAMVEQNFQARHAELAHRGLRRVIHAVWVVAADAGVAPNEAALARMLVFREELHRAAQGHPTAEQFRAAAQRLDGGPAVRVEELAAFDQQGRTVTGAAYVPAFAEAVWALAPGEPLSEPFTSSYGVHVALLLEEVAPLTRTDDEARAIVRRDLIVRARADATRAIVLGLRQRRRVQIREEALRQVERLARRAP